MKRQSYVYNHSFYCINCGKESIPIPRKRGHQHARGHRKDLYCPYCQKTVNHVECKTYEDVIQFKEDFANGVFKDEATNSLSFVRSSWLGQKYMG